MEENTYTIYKFTFSDGKVYIGQTEKPVEDRWKNGEGYKGQEVYVPIILEGWDNIQKEILHTNLSLEQANKLEKYYIKKFNSRENGYNRTNGGGNGGSKKQKELEQQQNEEKKIQLEQELSKKIPSLCDINNPNRILTFSEARKYAELFPEMEVILEWESIGPQIIECKNCANSLDVYDGGTGQYTYSYLVDWRIWIGDPSAKTMLRAPWLHAKEVFDYNKLFVTDEKVKKHLKTHNDFPATFMKQFYDYYKH